MARRRGFTTLSVLMVLVLLVSTSFYALTSLAENLREVAESYPRNPYAFFRRGEFSQAPTNAFVGTRPQRDGAGRGGMWSASTLDSVAAATPVERVSTARLVPGAPSHTLAVDAAPGASYPWEGTTPASDGGAINTGNGNKLTKLNLLSWNIRGGSSLDFTPYDNSQTRPMPSRNGYRSPE